jgi:hypothetical protein
MLAFLVLFNLYPLIPLQKGAAAEGAFARPRIAWEYLYGGAPEESVQLQYAPMIQYINASLSPEHDKVYDTSRLILFASYSDVLFYSGTKSIEGATSWDLLTPNAIQHLSDSAITYVAMNGATVKQLQSAPINGCLQPIHQTPDDQYLFRVEYARVIDSATSRCSAGGN